MSDKIGNQANNKYVESISFQCVNISPKRREKMTARFSQVGLDVQFPDPPLLASDFSYRPNVHEQRLASATANHIKCIQQFLDSGKKYGIVCEDDVHLIRTFRQDLDLIITMFEHYQFDILLLGHLLPVHTTFHPGYIQKLEYSYSCHQYNEYYWGAQMYLINRSYGQYLADRFSYDKLPILLEQKVIYSPDWIVTKKTNKRALLLPMMAVEEDPEATQDGVSPHINYHRDCHHTNYNPAHYFP